MNTQKYTLPEHPAGSLFNRLKSAVSKWLNPTQVGLGDKFTIVRWLHDGSPLNETMWVGKELRVDSMSGEYINFSELIDGKNPHWSKIPNLRLLPGGNCEIVLLDSPISKDTREAMVAKAKCANLKRLKR